MDSTKRSAPLTLTWLNHYTAQTGLASGLDYSQFNLIGVDGLLLRGLLADNGLPRTSADVVLPLVLAQDAGLRIGIIGSTSDGLQSALSALDSTLHPSNSIAYARHGYGRLPSAADLFSQSGPLDILILGLGAPKQDAYAIELAGETCRPTVILTCGGWLDQVSNPAYYPTWAYQLKLNWLIRMAREPRRLWRRYTIDAASACRNRREIRSWASELTGLKTYRSLSTPL